MPPTNNIPNTFQHPNAFVDVLMPLLNDTENTCVTLACRKILGWQEHRMSLRDRISLTQFGQTGKSRQAIIKALAILGKANILLAIGGEQSRKGHEYELNLGQLGEYNLEFLSSRRQTKVEQDLKRTAKGRAALLVSGTDQLTGQWD